MPVDTGAVLFWKSASMSDFGCTLCLDFMTRGGSRKGLSARADLCSSMSDPYRSTSRHSESVLFSAFFNINYRFKWKEIPIVCIALYMTLK